MLKLIALLFILLFSTILQANEKPITYHGEPMSLSFQQIPIRTALQIIADFTGINIVATDSVEGNITLQLQQTPWDEVLDIILKSNHLEKRHMGNIILIAPHDEMVAREKLVLEAKQHVENLTSLQSDFIQMDYAKAADIASLLKEKENSLLSSRGNVSVDTRTNMLLVQDTAQNLEMIYEMIETLDIPVRQVMIQARIVNASRRFEQDLGILWNAPESASMPFAPANKLAMSDPKAHLSINLPTINQAPTSTLSLAIGQLNGDTLLDLELQAAESESTVDILSSPRLLTANQKEARIKQGEEIPYQESSASGATTTAFKDAVLELRVTPQITPDNRVILDLLVKQDVKTDVTVQGVPVIDTKEVETQVLVDDGDTIVLGGVLENSQTQILRSVPFLAELPWIGALFRSTSTQEERTELLIFVTPRIAD